MQDVAGCRRFYLFLFESTFILTSLNIFYIHIFSLRDQTRVKYLFSNSVRQASSVINCNVSAKASWRVVRTELGCKRKQKPSSPWCKVSTNPFRQQLEPRGMSTPGFDISPLSSPYAFKSINSAKLTSPYCRSSSSVQFEQLTHLHTLLYSLLLRIDLDRWVPVKRYGVTSLEVTLLVSIQVDPV